MWTVFHKLYNLPKTWSVMILWDVRPSLLTPNTNPSMQSISRLKHIAILLNILRPMLLLKLSFMANKFESFILSFFKNHAITFLHIFCIFSQFLRLPWHWALFLKSFNYTWKQSQPIARLSISDFIHSFFYTSQVMIYISFPNIRPAL